MDKYYDQYGTPLKYHNFLKWFSLPLVGVVLFVRIMNIMINMDNLNSFYLIDLFFYCTDLIVICVTLYGFYCWKPCGFYGMMAHMGVCVVYDLLLLGVYSVYAPSEIAASVWGLIGNGIARVIIGIYYLKRRPLFFEKMQMEYISRVFSQKAQTAYPASPVPTADKSMGDVTRCRVCGEKLNMGRASCMKCGTAVPYVTAVQAPQAVTPTAQPATFPVQGMSAERPCYCHKCGNKLIEYSKFCNKCGTKVMELSG